MTADVTLAAPDAGWPGSAVYALPVGWSALPGTSRQEAQWLAEPRTVRGRDGGSFLEWAGAREGTPVTVRLTRVATAPAGAVRVAALRDEAARADQSAELMVGPGVAFFAPVDGTVLATDRLFVGVRGEPGRPVTLFDGDSMLANGTTRLDGVHDFINVQLGAGPHRLRARLDNSWGQARWDSATVHVNGGPARFVAVEDTVQLMADGRSSVPVRIRVVDVWGVPVTHPTAVTVRASGARLAGADEDRSSVGDQRRSDAAGWVVIPVVAGRDAGGGALELRADSVRLVLPLRQQLHVRPLVLTGTGVVGTGAALAVATTANVPTPQPGQDVTFTSAHTSTGNIAATSLLTVTNIPLYTDFKLGTATFTAGTSGLTAVLAYSNNGGTSWSYVPVSGGGGAPAGYDRSVTHLRWTFTGALSPVAPNNSVSVSFQARVR